MSGRGERTDLAGRSPWVVLATVLFGLFSVNITITILAVSIHRIAGEFHTADATMTWVVTGPMLAFGVIGPSVGKLGDRLGQRRIYLFGLFGAAVMAACSALAWNAQSLILFRVLGAVEGAATGPASFAIISRVFPREQRVKALGFWSMVGAGAPVLGVVIGGPIVEAFGWRVIFIAQVPLTLLGLLVAWLIIPETPRQRTGTFDVAGAVLVALGVTPLLFALSEGPRAGWTSPVVLGCFVLSPLMLWAFVRVEQRAAYPLLPLRYFRRRNFTYPLVSQSFLNGAYMGSFILTPLLLQNVLGYSESRTGFLSIARPLAFAIAGPFGGFVAVKIGERTSAVAGAASVIGALIMMSMLGVGSTDVMIMASLALAGVGMGIASPSLASSVTNAVDETDFGIAGAAQQMMMQIGIVFGIQIMQTVQQVRLGPAGLAGSYHEAYLAGAVLAAVGLVTAAQIRRIERTRLSSVAHQVPNSAEMIEPGIELLPDAS